MHTYKTNNLVFQAFRLGEVGTWCFFWQFARYVHASDGTPARVFSWRPGEPVRRGACLMFQPVSGFFHGAREGLAAADCRAKRFPYICQVLSI